MTMPSQNATQTLYNINNHTKRNYYIVNTNYAKNPEAHKDMLREQKAAAYYAPYKYKIDKIQNGDRVLLYKSGTGIVAVGVGSGKVNIREYQGAADEEHGTPLEDFHILKRPLPAKEMKKVTNSHLVFLQTIFSIDRQKGDLIWEHTMTNCL